MTMIPEDLKSMEDSYRVSELLRPRYKMIADFPGAKSKVGTVWTNKHGSTMDEYFDKYPHLFRKLEWWEERKPEDMPQYVKLNKQGAKILEDEEGAVYKVNKFSGKDGRLDHLSFSVQLSGTCSWFLPATETEYLIYQQSKQKV